MEATLVLIAPESYRLEVAVSVNVFTGLELMGLKQTADGRRLREQSLTVQLAGAWGGGVCRRLFHICCLHMGNLTLPLRCRPPKNPIKSSASAQDDCLCLPKHF